MRIQELFPIIRKEVDSNTVRQRLYQLVRSVLRVRKDLNIPNDALNLVNYRHTLANCLSNDFDDETVLVLVLTLMKLPSYTRYFKDKMGEDAYGGHLSELRHTLQIDENGEDDDDILETTVEENVDADAADNVDVLDEDVLDQDAYSSSDDSESDGEYYLGIVDRLVRRNNVLFTLNGVALTVQLLLTAVMVSMLTRCVI